VAEHVSPAAREKVIEELADHFAHDRLTLPEYERRVELAYRADTGSALTDLLRDLTPLPSVRLASAGAPARAADAPLTMASGRPKNFFAMMSGVVRKGAWTVPARLRAFACMGGISLDLREANLSGEVTEIFVFAMMGGVEIILPPDVRLESDGFAIMGGFEDQLKEPASRDPNAPLIRIRGFAIMGGVEARVAGPDDESKPD
jgi:hypothetical protein